VDKHYQAMPDIEVLPAHFPIPGAGFLPVNAFVIKAKEPVLIDTGMGIDGEGFMKALGSVINPRDLKWIWLTHDDADHTGNIQKVLAAAPNARLVANSLAILRMSTARPVAMKRVYWLNPGDSIDVGDRTLIAIRPPLFDNPTTIGVYDSRSETFFSADCFGAILPSPARNAKDLQAEVLKRGIIGWAGADSPWVHMVEPAKFNQALTGLLKIAPKAVLSAHLPQAVGMTKRLLDILARVPSSPPFVSPGQAELEKILAQMKGRS
jgi:hypothetical protein